ncbi:MAG: response regulator [Phycisphaerae bacterium]|nr:response regulator [Phycisphaerae bacterium]
MPGKMPQALVIDDDADMNSIVGAYVEMSGLDYRSAPNARQGLEEIERSKPDVVLLDVMLPDMDGFEVLRQIREHESTRKLPVIMLTALRDPESMQRGRDAGASDYVSKPFDPDVLMQALKKHASTNGSHT